MANSPPMPCAHKINFFAAMILVSALATAVTYFVYRQNAFGKNGGPTSTHKGHKGSKYAVYICTGTLLALVVVSFIVVPILYKRYLKTMYPGGGTSTS